MLGEGGPDFCRRGGRQRRKTGREERELHAGSLDAPDGAPLFSARHSLVVRDRLVLEIRF
jgi:hypothetical protein